MSKGKNTQQNHNQFSNWQKSKAARKESKFLYKNSKQHEDKHYQDSYERHMQRPAQDRENPLGTNLELIGYVLLFNAIRPPRL